MHQDKGGNSPFISRMLLTFSPHKNKNQGVKMDKKFSAMNRNELATFIEEKKTELKDEVKIIGYTGQFDDLLKFADFTGDPASLVKMSTELQAEYLVFTGWRFFSDIPCIITPKRKVIQANIKNDCPLAERIDEEAVKNMFALLQAKSKKQVIPVAYVAANYKLRSFCGQHGGSTCTPGNALKVIEYYLSQNKSVFFIPANDAFNVITALNLPEDELCTINSHIDGNSIPGDKKLYAWNVECFVHAHYTIEDVTRLKEKYDGIKLIGHKECAPEILDLCDYSCFIPEMYQILKNAPSGSIWGVGTVDTWVSRVAKEFPDKTIISFRPDLVCEDMKITDWSDIAECLQSISDYKAGRGTLKTEITVPQKYRETAAKALYKMFEINQTAVR